MQTHRFDPMIAYGVIRYTQGHITIVDRQGLEARVCECYEVVQNEFVRLLGYSKPALYGSQCPGA